MGKQQYFNNKDDTTLTRISRPSHKAIKRLAEKRGMRMITVLEYILRGEISIKELEYEKFKHRRYKTCKRKQRHC